MTADQLTLGDCEPMWDGWEQLCQRDAADPRWRDLRYQEAP